MKEMQVIQQVSTLSVIDSYVVFNRLAEKQNTDMNCRSPAAAKFQSQSHVGSYSAPVQNWLINFLFV